MQIEDLFFGVLTLIGVIIMAALLISAITDDTPTTFETACASQGGQPYHDVCLNGNKVVLDGRNK